MTYTFWSGVVLLALVPLVAIWRNCSALALLMAEAWESPRLPRGTIERGLKGAVAVGLASWVTLVMPRAPFAHWGWIFLALGTAVIATVFSRRLIYWHSQWQTSVRDVLADRRADVEELRVEARSQLGRSLDTWRVAVAEVTIPAGGAITGKTLAKLALPSRFGCAVIEVERNGRALRAPSGDFAVYPGDTLLLVGQREQIAGVRQVLEQRDGATDTDADFSGAVLDTCRVAAWQAGLTLGELGIAANTGVRVVGIRRGEERIITPAARERLAEGDELLLLGTLPTLRRFRQWRPARAVAPEQLHLTRRNREGVERFPPG